MEKINDLIKRYKHFIKFCIVGTISTIFNYTLFYVMLTLLNINHIFSAASGYMLGLFIGFYLNKFFTFKSKKKKYFEELYKYLFIYLFSLVLGLIILESLVQLGLNPLISNLFNITFTTIFHFIGIKYFVFLKNEFLYDKLFKPFFKVFLLIFIFLNLELLFNLIFINIFNLNNYYFGFLLILICLFIFYLLTIKKSKYNNIEKIKVNKNNKLKITFLTFYIIGGFLSLTLNNLLKFSYENYFLFRYSFLFITSLIIIIVFSEFYKKNSRKVYFALYLKEDENIDQIYKKIGKKIDGIHLDIVEGENLMISKGFKVKNKWPNKKIISHIMSKKPSKYIKDVLKFSDSIFFHIEIEGSIEDLIDNIKKNNKKVGIVIKHDSDLKELSKYMNEIDSIQIMGIDKLGLSGQRLNKESLNILKQVKKIIKNKKNKEITLFFDGGVNLKTIKNIDCKNIITRSFILESKKPKRNIKLIKNE